MCACACACARARARACACISADLKLPPKPLLAGVEVVEVRGGEATLKK